MDNLEAAETNLGKFVPMHLLKFDDDHHLKSGFRRLIEVNYEKGIVKSESGLCEACGLPLWNNSRTRMKSSRKKTHNIFKLLAKERVGGLFGKYNNFLLGRYKRSCTQMIVQCGRCQHLNRENLISNEMKQSLKDEILQEVLIAAEGEGSSTPSQRKKKKKRKKKKSDGQDNCGLNIPSTLKPSKSDGQKDQTDSCKGLSEISGKITQRNLSTPCQKSLSVTPAFVNTSNLRRPPKTLKAVPSSQKRRGLGETVGTPGQNKKTTGLKQKDLKKLLAQEQPEGKRASLSDFLSSL